MSKAWIFPVLLTLFAILFGPTIYQEYADYRNPTKEIEIWIDQITSADDKSFSKDDLWHYAPGLIRICDKNIIFISNRTKKVSESFVPEEHPYYMSLPPTCLDCYYYDIIFRNRGDDYNEEFEFFVSMDAEDILTVGVDPKILITPPSGMPKRMGLYVNIPSMIKGEEFLLSFITPNDINFSFEAINNDKGKFFIVERDIGIIQNPDATNNFFDSLDIPSLEVLYDDKDIHIFRFDMPTWEFVEMDIEPFYSYVDEAFCDKNTTYSFGIEKKV